MKTLFRRTLMVLVMSAISGSAFAVDSLFPGGIYVTEGDSHYKNSEMTFSVWGDGYTMNAILMRDGREYEVEAFLRPTARNQYSGSGIITVRYSPTSSCGHKFGIKVIKTEHGLFVRENTPRNIPYNPNHSCAAAGPNIWFNHPSPYLLAD